MRCITDKYGTVHHDAATCPFIDCEEHSVTSVRNYQVVNVLKPSSSSEVLKELDAVHKDFMKKQTHTHTHSQSPPTSVLKSYADKLVELNTPKCECGADTAQLPYHSHWCPKGVGK